MLPLARSALAAATIFSRLSDSGFAEVIATMSGLCFFVQKKYPPASAASTSSAISWPRWSVGRPSAIGPLPHRLHERDGADVNRIRNAVVHRHGKRRHGTIRFDHGL